MAKDLVFVNQRKFQRAEGILKLVTGALVPKTDSEMDTKTKFQAFFTEAGVDPASEEAIEFVYEKLGGLVRTQAEQVAADKAKAEAMEKGKKRQVELPR